MIYQLTSPWNISGSVTIPGGATLNPSLPPNSNYNWFAYNGVFIIPSIVTANQINQAWVEFNLWNALAVGKVPPPVNQRRTTMSDVRLNPKHGSLESREAKRLRPSNETSTADHHAVTGSGERRTSATIHHSGSNSTHGAMSPLKPERRE